MKKNLIRYGLLCCFLLCFTVCFGQSDSSRFPASTLAAIHTFNKAVGVRSWLYNGAGYRLVRKMKGNPNFRDSAGTSIGSVTYYGFGYTNIPLLYDIHDDLVVTTWIDGNSLFSLTSDMVSGFTLPGHYFIRLTAADVSRSGLKPGFYDELYSGKVQALARYIKTIHVVNTFVSPDDYYEYKSYYYLKKDGNYYTIASEGDLLDVLKDRKDELKKYIKDQRINFRNDPERAMQAIAAYYDHLTN